MALNVTKSFSVVDTLVAEALPPAPLSFYYEKVELLFPFAI